MGLYQLANVSIPHSQRCNKWPRSPPPPRRGLGSENPRGRGFPAGIPEVLPDRGTRVCAPTFLSQHSQHTCTYLNYGTTLMHSYVKLFALLIYSVTSTCNISFLMVTILHHCTPRVQHLPSPFCGL